MQRSEDNNDVSTLPPLDPEEKTKATDEEEIDDWKLEFDFHVFAQHEARKISSPHLKVSSDTDDSNDDDERYILVECVESLTPVDMMNLGAGIHDATGHCVWMGAFLLMDALPCLQSYFHEKRVV